MNRFPLWKNLMIGLVLVVGLLYSLPNLFGEAPAVQVSPLKATATVDAAMMAKVEQTLKAAHLPYDAVELETNGAKVRFADTETQLKAKDALQAAFGESYVAALNLVPNTPNFLRSIGAHPMFLGLDLRGGVHFMLELDMQAAIEKTMEGHARDMRMTLKDRKIRYVRIIKDADTATVSFRDADAVEAAFPILKSKMTGIGLTKVNDGSDFKIVAKLSNEELTAVRKAAVDQNIATLRNRVNELGVSEPIIQQQGADRIVVQLPGVQDTAKAKDLIGRTAALELRMVVADWRSPDVMEAALKGDLPPNTVLVDDNEAYNPFKKLLLKGDVELTGNNIEKADPSFDQRSNQPAVSIKLDSVGADIFKQLTRENVGKKMAMVLIDRGRAEVITAPNINEEIGGGQVQISGAMSSKEASDVALLLRSGSLAAPMHIVEERTIGPSLGKENIARGFHSTWVGFALVALLMLFYYRVFGVISVVSLAVNVLLLVAVLSMLQATLTLPGIAAMALALGMAIDSNVLINERIREEIKAGNSPQVAISEGYKHAWATIIDSNVTTLIVGLMLMIFGTGPVRGFAVVHCLGILTSMFSAVLVSRGLVNLVYGGRKKLKTLSI
ncbi:protein translocase subunit SecD [Leeia sp. TBRC 13508]|uniref:Protein translocase subunit SecD n=1 Tax=Leeia speluncae TaxID=2884804 RepID=A0ABS8D4S0_9NEIS|nr:protein translocase subunit SecD [Leeia speluncae]MCB6183211.1 protein translocase subunit SecD [Leeia speluncae]